MTAITATYSAQHPFKVYCLQVDEFIALNEDNEIVCARAFGSEKDREPKVFNCKTTLKRTLKDYFEKRCEPVILEEDEEIFFDHENKREENNPFFTNEHGIIYLKLEYIRVKTPMNPVSHNFSFHLIPDHESTAKFVLDEIKIKYHNYNRTRYSF